jgi:hypothetical protein
MRKARRGRYKAFGSAAAPSTPHCMMLSGDKAQSSANARRLQRHLNIADCCKQFLALGDATRNSICKKASGAGLKSFPHTKQVSSVGLSHTSCAKVCVQSYLSYLPQQKNTLIKVLKSGSIEQSYSYHLERPKVVVIIARFPTYSQNGDFQV